MNSGTQDTGSEELITVVKRLGRALVQPLDDDGLAARHLRYLLNRLLKSLSEERHSGEVIPPPQRISWRRLKELILAEDEDARTSGKPFRSYADGTFKGVRKDIQRRLLSFHEQREEAVLHGTTYRFWFELDAGGRQGVRLNLRKEAIAAQTCRPLVRPVLSNFQRRDGKHTQIRDSFGRNPPSQAVCLWGIPGGGKTELAIYSAHAADVFTGGVLFVPARELDLREIFERIVDFLEIRIPAAADETVLQRHYMQAKRDERVLIILDDVAPSLVIEDLRPPAGVALLITSRRRLDSPWIVTVEVGEFEEAEAREYLLANTNLASRARPGASLWEVAQHFHGIRGEDGDYGASPSLVDTLAVMCGRLPGALALAATTLRVHGNAFEYGEHLASSQARIRSITWSPGSNSLEEAFRSVYSELSQKARALVRRLSVLRDPFDASAASSLFGSEAADALHELEAFGLLHWDPLKKRYAFNELLRDFFGMMLHESDDESVAHERLARHLAERVIAVAERLERRHGWPDAMTQVRDGRDAEEQRQISNTIASVARWLLRHPESPQVSLLPHFAIAITNWGMLPNRVFLHESDSELQSLADAAVAISRTLDDRTLLRRLLLAVPAIASDPAAYAGEGLALAAADTPDEYRYALENVIRRQWLPTKLSERVRLFEDMLREDRLASDKMRDARRLARTCTYAGAFERAARVLSDADEVLKSAAPKELPAACRVVLATDRARTALYSGQAHLAREILEGIDPSDDEWAAIVNHYSRDLYDGALAWPSFDIVEPIALYAEAVAAIDEKAGRDAFADAVALRDRQDGDAQSDRGLLDIGRAAYFLGEMTSAEALLARASDSRTLTYEERAEAYYLLALIWNSNQRPQAARDFMWAARKAFRLTEYYLRPMAEERYAAIASALDWPLE